VAMMVRVLLPASTASTSDAADALAVAICHAQHRSARARGVA
jgi:crossover junction endodeoxyribonuclease RuvC